MMMPGMVSLKKTEAATMITVIPNFYTFLLSPPLSTHTPIPKKTWKNYRLGQREQTLFFSWKLIFSMKFPGILVSVRDAVGVSLSLLEPVALGLLPWVSSFQKHPETKCN